MATGLKKSKKSERNIQKKEEKMETRRIYPEKLKRKKNKTPKKRAAPVEAPNPQSGFNTGLNQNNRYRNNGQILKNERPTVQKNLKEDFLNEDYQNSKSNRKPTANRFNGRMPITTTTTPTVKLTTPSPTRSPVRSLEERHNSEYSNKEDEKSIQTTRATKIKEPRAQHMIPKTTTLPPKYNPYDDNVTVIGSTMKPSWTEDILQTRNLQYGGIVLGTIILLIAILALFKKYRMGCFSGLWRWTCQFPNWICRKVRKIGKRKSSNEIEPAKPIPRVEQKRKWEFFKTKSKKLEKKRIPSTFEKRGEQEKLFMDGEFEKSQTNFQNDLNDILSTIASTSKDTRFTKTPKEDFDEILSDFEESLKPTKEEEETNRYMNEKIRQLSEEAKRIKKDMENKKAAHKSETSSAAGSFSEIDEEEKEFRRKLDEQNRIFEEKLKKMKEMREEKERLAEEERQQMRFEIHQRLAAFLACIQLGIRFSEKEEEWSDSLKKLRAPLAKVSNSYYDLQNEIKNADYDDEFSRSCVESEGKIFAKKLLEAQNMLVTAFDYLADLTKNYEDRIFIKMIMKSISDQGQICKKIGDELVNVMKNQSDYQIKNMNRLNEVVSQLDAQKIPTTGELKSKSKSAREEDYLNIDYVPYPDWFSSFN